ncbi:hypothetical protein G6F46_015471 [Rhizopus delemar]|nr:hypothetical protein G6F46_015471 [Rhizopus delemar]
MHRVVIAQRFDRLRHAVAGNIGRRSAGDRLQGADAARDQAGIFQFAGAEHAVHGLLHHIHGAVAQAKHQLDVGVFVVEITQ